jgi:hypothetical protein
MGGKNALIIDADADLDEAVVHIIDSASVRRQRSRHRWSRWLFRE